MKIQLAFYSVLLSSSLFATDLDSNLLSTLKKEQISLENERIENDALKEKYSWINPLNANMQKLWSTQFDSHSGGEGFSIGIDQPIFKSGGIYFKIKHATAHKNLSLLSLKDKEHALIADVVSLLYKIHQSYYEVQKQKALLENAEIDVQRKSESYLSGDLDSGFLDNAILIKNRQSLLLVEYIKNNKVLILQLKNISDVDANTIALPKFSMLKEEVYINNNLDVLKKDQVSKLNYYNKKLVSSSRLPSVSFLGSYNYSQPEYLPLEMQGNKYYRQYGIKATIPLYNFTTERSLQSAQLDYLKVQSELLETKHFSKNNFAISQENIIAIEKKVALTKENKKLYEKLLADTKELFLAGERTEYDVLTLQNSVNIKEYELKILALDKQSELLKLYEKMDKLQFDN